MNTTISNLLPAIANKTGFDFSFCKLCNKYVGKLKNQRSLSAHLKHKHRGFNIKSYYEMFWETPFCKCGCGIKTKWLTGGGKNWWTEYVYKHYLIKNNPAKRLPDSVPVVKVWGGKRTAAVLIKCWVCKKEFLRAMCAKTFKQPTCTKKCRLIQLRYQNAGCNNPNWQGGVGEPDRIARTGGEYQNWRRTVVNRDHFVCQLCHRENQKIHCHHILKFVSYKDYRYETWNGISLCSTCHEGIVHREEDYIERFLRTTCGEANDVGA